MKALKCDLNKSILNIGYVGAVLLTTLLCFTAKAYTDPNTAKIYTVFECIAKLDKQLFADDYSFSSYLIFAKGMSGYMAMFLPIIAAFPFMTAFCAERNGGSMRFTITRTGGLRYYLSKFCSAFLCGGSAVLFGYIIFGVIVRMIFPSLSQYELSADNLSFVLVNNKNELIGVLRYMLSAFLGTAVYLGTGDVTAHSMACCADSAMMFPLGYSEGISISVDLKQLSSICPEVLKNAGVEADQLRDRFCSGKPSAIPSCSDLEHIFAPLFSAPVSVRISLLKLKVLEILIYLSNMKSEHKELTQYFSQQTELIKEIHQQLTEHLDQRFTIEELSKQYLINTSTLKEIFKAVYGHPIATYMKEFRMRQAMKLLRETNATIADIASQVGYQTQGKFSSAFQAIVKMSPREYRKIQGIAPSDSFSKTL